MGEKVDDFLFSTMKKNEIISYQWKYRTNKITFFSMMHGSSDTILPVCNLPEDMIQCRNPEMKVCRKSALPYCPVCYCSDHQYQSKTM